MRSSSHFVPTLVAAGDLFALVAAWLVARQVAPPGFTPVVLVPLAILHQLVLSTGSLHTQLRFLTPRDLLLRVLMAWARIAAAVCVLCCIVPQRIPRDSAIVFSAAFLVTLAAVRFGSSLLRRWVRQRGANLRYVVIAGGGDAAQRARQHCTADPGFGLRIIGHLLRPEATAA